MKSLDEIGIASKLALKELSKLDTNKKNQILKLISKEILNNSSYIIEANLKDIDAAKKDNIKDSLIDRLLLNEKRIKEISDAFLQIADLDDPIGEILYMKKLKNNLTIGQKRVGMGVIGIIYEARPNVTADAFALCLKVSSCVILRGGKEALNTNKALINIFRTTLSKNGSNPDYVQLIEDPSRETAVQFMKLNKYIDLLIPRGGKSLIDSVIQNSTIPTIETGTGNCHIFVDESGDFDMALKIIVNSKTQRTGVCNACESLLVHKSIAKSFLPKVYNELKKYNVEIRGCKESCIILPEITQATDSDYYEEFLDLIISLKVVENIDEAIDHISEHGTKHSEAIITESYTNSMKFTDEVDAAAVYVNASTRFTDGFEFGFGAEIGISTQKLHARGPMGLKELTTTKYVVLGNGQTRD